MKPKSVNILGKKYKILYKKKPSDVDIYQRDSLWGQIDYWTRTIRIFDKDRDDQDVWHTIWHEIIHGIANVQKMKFTEDETDRLALGINDVLIRNKWIKKL